MAGFSESDLEIEARENTLLVAGRQGKEDDKQRHFLHRGIAARAFERTFRLADHVRVVGASLENGLLHVDLVRDLPEAMRPRRIRSARAPDPRSSTPTPRRPGGLPTNRRAPRAPTLGQAPSGACPAFGLVSRAGRAGFRPVALLPRGGHPPAVTMPVRTAPRARAAERAGPRPRPAPRRPAASGRSARLNPRSGSPAPASPART